MTPKERAAMQQALEALEEMFHSNSTKVAIEKYNTAHTALREALAEPQVDWQEEALRLGGLNAKHVGELRKLKAEQELNLNCKSVQKRLATSWGYVLAEQAEQEPVAWMVYTADGQSVYVTDNPTDIKVGQRALPLYTAPVRTKDLTDDEIYSICIAIGGCSVMDCFKYYRAFIAADREKNK